MSNSVERKLKREKQQPENLTPLFGQGNSVDIRSMPMPRTLVVDADTDKVFIGIPNTPIRELKPVFEDVKTVEDIIELKKWFEEHQGHFDKVVMLKEPTEEDIRRREEHLPPHMRDLPMALQHLDN